MTNFQIAELFLSRFDADESDRYEFAAMLDAAEERGRIKVEWACDEPTTPGDLTDMARISAS